MPSLFADATGLGLLCSLVASSFKLFNTILFLQELLQGLYFSVIGGALKMNCSNVVKLFEALLCEQYYVTMQIQKLMHMH